MLKQKFLDIKRDILLNPLYISILFLLFSIVFLFIFFNKITNDSIVEQVQHRQQLSVRATSKSIEVLLNSIGRNLVLLENNINQSELDNFISLWSDSYVTGLVVTNENGIIIKNSNTTGAKAVGIDVSDRDYFKWAETAKDTEYKVFPPVISKTGASEGKYIVTVATPIIRDGKFAGVIDVAILLTDLTSNYIDNTKVLDSSKVYLVTNEGEIIYSDYSELTGKKFMDIFQSDFIGKEKITEILLDDLKNDQETKMKLAVPNLQNKLKLEPYLISSAPIHLSGQLWKLVIVTPEKDLVSFTNKTSNQQATAVFIITVLFIVLTLRSSKNTGYKEAVVDEHLKHNIGDEV